MAVTPLPPIVGSKTAAGDVLLEVIPVRTLNGVQINPDGGRFRMRQPDGVEYTAVPEIDTVTFADKVVTSTTASSAVAMVQLVAQ